MGPLSGIPCSIILETKAIAADIERFRAQPFFRFPLNSSAVMKFAFGGTYAICPIQSSNFFRLLLPGHFPDLPTSIIRASSASMLRVIPSPMHRMWQSIILCNVNTNSNSLWSEFFTRAKNRSIACSSSISASGWSNLSL